MTRGVTRGVLVVVVVVVDYLYCLPLRVRFAVLGACHALMLHVLYQDCN
jgi:hypothetical protein